MVVAETVSSLKHMRTRAGNRRSVPTAATNRNCTGGRNAIAWQWEGDLCFHLGEGSGSRRGLSTLLLIGAERQWLDAEFRNAQPSAHWCNMRIVLGEVLSLLSPLSSTQGEQQAAALSIMCHDVQSIPGIVLLKSSC